VGSRYN